MVSNISTKTDIKRADAQGYRGFSAKLVSTGKLQRCPRVTAGSFYLLERGLKMIPWNQYQCSEEIKGIICIQQLRVLPLGPEQRA